MKKIQNKYCYLESDFIGQGAYSKVYKGFNNENKEIVAIKCIDWSKVNDKYFINGFQREVRIMRDLDHVNIVRIHDMIRENHMTYLILEYCDSQNLTQFVNNSGGKLSENVSKIVLQQLLTALHEMIDKSYLHRDIKPDNILIHERTLKLADFGFSIQADYSGHQLLSDKVGTPLYMSPQLLENKHYSVKSDVWSMGILAFEIITGLFPWGGDDSQQLLKSIQTKPLVFPTNIQISDEYKDFIRGCLQIKENDRFNWDDLYEHKIFEKKYVIEKQQANKYNLQIEINQLKQAVVDRSTPIEQLFANLDLDGDHKLTFEEFQALLLYVNNTMEINIQKTIFKNYNKSRNNLLNFDEFNRIFI